MASEFFLDSSVVPEVVPNDVIQLENDDYEGHNDVDQAQGRKRKRNKEAWKRTVNSAKRHSGKAYVNRSGRNILEKTFRNVNCGCSRKCSESVNPEERRMIFESFYKLGDNTKQNIYLRGLIHNATVKQRRARNSSREPKTKSIKYYLTTATVSTRVCKKFFIDTFQISDGRIYKVSSSSQPSTCIDKRGHREPANKIDVTRVKDHIQSFPSYRSHYTLSDAPNRRYLNPDLTIRKMYQLYVEKCGEDGTEPVKEKMYYHVFSSSFNLHFKPPAKDTCHLCDSLQNILTFSENDEEKRKADIDKKLHLRKAEQSRTVMNSDKISAGENNNNYYVLTFDMEKALAFPKLSTSVAYYKQNMYVYNLGIHSFNDNKGYMYMWDETEGSRGSQEIGACLVKHLKVHARGHNHIIMYSDCCTGQNRNIKLSLLLQKLVQDPEMPTCSIDHKFMVSGHSYLPNDADFGVIESKARKKQFIYGPRDWFDLVAAAKKTNPFPVTVMNREEFLSTKKLEDSICNRKTNTEGAKVNWLNIKWLRYCKNKPNSIFYKETLQDDFPFYEIDIKKPTSKGRPPNLYNIIQDPLYSQRRPVKAVKKKHMFDLLPYIPPTYHPYFRSLPSLNDRTRASTSQANELNLGAENGSESDEYID